MHGKTSTSNDERLCTEGKEVMAYAMQRLPDDFSRDSLRFWLSSLAFDMRLRPDEEALVLAHHDDQSGAGAE